MREMKATLLQQVESHLLKLARLHPELKAGGKGARIIMAVHYSLWVECPEKEAEQVRNLMRRIMITAGKLKVPLNVDIDS